jgi:hypothetical protein
MILTIVSPLLVIYDTQSGITVRDASVSQN